MTPLIPPEVDLPLKMEHFRIQNRNPETGWGYSPQWEEHALRPVFDEWGYSYVESTTVEKYPNLGWRQWHKFRKGPHWYIVEHGNKEFSVWTEGTRMKWYNGRGETALRRSIASKRSNFGGEERARINSLNSFKEELTKAYKTGDRNLIFTKSRGWLCEDPDNPVPDGVTKVPVRKVDGVWSVRPADWPAMTKHFQLESLPTSIKQLKPMPKAPPPKKRARKRAKSKTKTKK